MTDHTVTEWDALQGESDRERKNMNAPKTFHVNTDVEAFMERAGADFTGNLVVRSEKLDDYDVYKLDENGEWDLAFDSLSNKANQLDDKAAFDALWERDDFLSWSREMKSLVKQKL